MRASGRRDIPTRLARAEDELRRLKLGNYGEGSGPGGSFDPTAVHPLGLAARRTHNVPWDSSTPTGGSGEFAFNAGIYDTSDGLAMFGAGDGPLYAPVDGVYRATGHFQVVAPETIDSVGISLQYVLSGVGGPPLFGQIHSFGGAIVDNGDGTFRAEAHGSVGVYMSAGGRVLMSGGVGFGATAEDWSADAFAIWLELEGIGLATGFF